MSEPQEVTMSQEQKARDLLERMEIPMAQGYSDRELVELANLITVAESCFVKEPRAQDPIELRDRFAMEAMNALTISIGLPEATPDATLNRARLAYHMADKMMEARKL